MHYFTYEGENLHAESVDLRAIIAEVGTPFYCYSESTLVHHYKVFQAALAPVGGKVHYALKANSNQSVIHLLGREGAGVDTVSAGEIMRALEANISPDKIIFSGVGKRDDELFYALSQKIYQINVETRGELHRLNRIAQELNCRAPVTFRVNPNVGSGGHEKITTGKSENKFGIELEQIGELCAEARDMAGIDLKGLACHIGSQIESLDPFEAAMIRMKSLLAELRQQGYPLSRLDLGGGLGVPYRDGQAPPLPKAYGEMVQRLFADMTVELAIEPGRLIAANAGILVSQVIERQEREDKTFVIVDTAMNDLLRPTLYEAFHEILPLRRRQGSIEKVDIVGPVCESGDYLARERDLVKLAPGDAIALMSAGAYGAVMSSTYNSRELIPEVLVRGEEWAVIRPRETLAAQISRDHLAPWMKSRS